jgi:hypothetical protein
MAVAMMLAVTAGYLADGLYTSLQVRTVGVRRPQCSAVCKLVISQDVAADGRPVPACARGLGRLA